MRGSVVVVWLVVVVQGLLAVPQLARLPQNVLSRSLPLPSVKKQILEAVSRFTPNHDKTTPELIRATGYPVEVHNVTTQDGYILELHRIPCGQDWNVSSASCQPRTPILLFHGLFGSSSDFIMNTPDKALAYMLADDGYDVWLTNSRGNTYSKKHVTLSPDEKEFWDFSWNEMSLYDLPATVDYILNTTQQGTLHYVGFSMGSTVMWAFLHHHPHYAHKLRLVVGLGPVAYMDHVQGPFSFSAPFVTHIEKTLNFLGHYELLSFGPIADGLLGVFCDERVFTTHVCRNILFLITGTNPTTVNTSFLSTILSHTPAGTSVRTFTHYLQIVKSGKFHMYDYGKKGNQEKYGSESAPRYKLERVTPAVAIFWCEDDWVAPPLDVQHLISELPNVVSVHHVSNPHFTHIDFMWGNNADEEVYHHLLELFDSWPEPKQ